MDNIKTFTDTLSSEQQKQALVGTATLLGFASALYLTKRLIFGKSKGPSTEQLNTPIALPGIVSDIDGVAIQGKNIVPGTKEALQKLLTQHADSGRCVPFTFLSNSGGSTEAAKADKMNKQIGLVSKSFLGRMFKSGATKLDEKHIMLSSTILSCESIQERFSDKMVLIEGYAHDEVEVFKNYGFKKVITLKELMSIETGASMWIGLDFYESLLRILWTRHTVLKRFGMTMEELKKNFKFDAIILNTASPRMGSFLQIVLDIISAKDGSLKGEKRGPKDPQVVTVITTNPDFMFQHEYDSPRFGPKSIELMIDSVCQEAYGYKVEYEQYGKPDVASFEFAEQVLQKRAKEQNINISKMYMIGDNPLSDIDGANRAGWTSILVKTGIFDPKAVTSDAQGNDIAHPATYVVETFKDAIQLIYRLEKLTY